MSDPRAGFERRFRAALEAAGLPGEGAPAVVAVSGGLDSVVLLHLLRFLVTPARLPLTVAHFDHRMRRGSGGDARWVRGLSAAWGLPVRVGRVARPPGSEEEARRARYDFLEDVRREARAEAVYTAHHADDQAETVLFRLLRGTGVGGLAGIPERRDPRVVRPLLGFWREELEAYARGARLAWRDDPTNEQLRYARNVLRRAVIPEVERRVAPGARRALVRLARQAREEEDAWASLLPALLGSVDLEEGAQGVSFDRGALRSLHPAVRARALRHLCGRLGLGLGDVATRLAVGFTDEGVSGSRLDLGGGLVLRRELDRLVLAHAPAVGPDRTVTILDPAPGRGEAVLGGRRVPVAWGAEVAGVSMDVEHFGTGDLLFPLLVRARAPGDRIRLPAGSKKLKKLMLEARIPPAARACLPVVADAEGAVLWVPGLGRVPRPTESADGDVLGIGIG